MYSKKLFLFLSFLSFIQIKCSNDDLYQRETRSILEILARIEPTVADLNKRKCSIRFQNIKSLIQKFTPDGLQNLIEQNNLLHLWANYQIMRLVLTDEHYYPKRCPVKKSSRTISNLGLATTITGLASMGYSQLPQKLLNPNALYFSKITTALSLVLSFFIFLFFRHQNKNLPPEQEFAERQKEFFKKIINGEITNPTLRDKGKKLTELLNAAKEIQGLINRMSTTRLSLEKPRPNAAASSSVSRSVSQVVSASIDSAPKPQTSAASSSSATRNSYKPTPAQLAKVKFGNDSTEADLALTQAVLAHFLSEGDQYFQTQERIKNE